jgi:hypothetical protein
VKNVNIFHLALTLSIFAGGILLAGWLVSSCWNWACREAFTDQETITVHHRAQAWLDKNPDFFANGVRVIAPTIERREEPKRRQRQQR